MHTERKTLILLEIPAIDICFFLHSQQFAFKFSFFDVVNDQKRCRKKLFNGIQANIRGGWFLLFFFVRCNLG